MISCGDGPAKKGVSCAAALNHYEGVVLLECVSTPLWHCLVIVIKNKPYDSVYLRSATGDRTLPSHRRAVLIVPSPPRPPHPPTHPIYPIFAI